MSLPLLYCKVVIEHLHVLNVMTTFELVVADIVVNSGTVLNLCVPLFEVCHPDNIVIYAHICISSLSIQMHNKSVNV